ncbi:Tfp pilus assembly protein PilF [Undibacterium pigrum]|uniref:Tfp pilus assembly protein PilF n=2 Tax=Undibacterium pigrum TaxID=401470 RepID=A0A318IZJ2_9BURK|nr:Tfp pilus assembly protein PilF [Undibacterium pigrum]
MRRQLAATYNVLVPGIPSACMKTDTAESLFYEANQLMAEGHFIAAEDKLRLALQIEEDLAEVHANLAWLMQQQGRYAEAEPAYQHARQLAPENVQISLNFGVMLAQQKRFDEAEQVYQQVLQQEPDSVFALSNLGVLLASTWREAEAEARYRRALELDPAYRKAAFNLAYLLLRQGRYAEGWHMLETRDGLDVLDKYLAEQSHLFRWQGQDLAGKSIIILFESGHGDMIQFARYASLLKQRKAVRVTCLCHPQLKKLFTTLDGLDDAYGFDESVVFSDWDYWVPLLSLPGLFQTRLETIPASLPYLHSPSSDMQDWGKLMSVAGNELRVGLVWKGNPHFENDADRSIHSPGVLQALADIPGVHWFSLQKGAGEEDVAISSMPQPMTALGPEIHDFADTAAILMQLDLLIAVDTAVVHLAGALGKPCWVMLPAFQPDWRWLKDRSDSPWYPGVMRLFRQTVPGDWSVVLQEVRNGLLKLI